MCYLCDVSVENFLYEVTLLVFFVFFYLFSIVPSLLAAASHCTILTPYSRRLVKFQVNGARFNVLGTAVFEQIKAMLNTNDITEPGVKVCDSSIKAVVQVLKVKWLSMLTCQICKR